MKIKKQVFRKRRKGDILEVWLPPIDHPEGELVLTINVSYLPALIAVLREETNSTI